MNRSATERLLRLEGYTVASAGTVHEAIREITRLRPRFILLDARLPDGDGLDVLHCTRASGVEARVAVVSGSIDSDVHLTYNRAGVEAVFTKPVVANAILDWLSADTQ